MSKTSESDAHAPIVEEVFIEPSDHENDRKGTAPAWLISLGAHAVAIAIMAAVVYHQMQPPVEYPPTRIPVVSVAPKEIPLDAKTAVEPTDLSIKVAEESDQPTPITEVEPLDIEPSNEDANADGSPGDVLAVATVETGSTGFFMSIGANSSGASMFSNRQGPGKIRAAREHGGKEAFTRASSVDAALRWFKRHQSPNGMWDVDQYQVNCTDGALKCEPGISQAGNADVACTAYALMCFLGAGHDHLSPGKYRETVTKAVEWLMAQQNAEGVFGERNYEHAIATQAMAEAMGLSNDSRLHASIQKAVDVILARQAVDPQAKDQAYAGLGWDYVKPKAARNDSSVTGWNVMALKAALGAGLQVGNSMQGAKNWLERAWKAANPDWERLDPYQGTSVFPYTYDAVADKAEKTHLSCVGALCAVYLGHHQGDVMLETMANTIMQNDYPTVWPTNTYFLYYNSLAIFQIGGERWEKWVDPVAKLIANAQRNDDSCFNGSWDYAGTKFHGHDTGRLLSTAYACLSQEVIWRTIRVQKN